MNEIQPELFDTVELLIDLPAEKLRAGMQGAIVEDYKDGAYEVEFIKEMTGIDALVTLTAAQFIIVWRQTTHESVPVAERLLQLTERLDPQVQEQMISFGQFLHARQQPVAT